MSIEQQPPKANQVDLDSMPPIDKTVIPPKEHRDDKHDKKLGWKKPAAAVALLGAIAAGAFGGSKVMGGENTSEPVPPKEPGVSAPAEPGQNEKDPEANEGEVSFTLNAEKYVDNREQLAEDFVAEYNEWQNSGYSAEAISDPKRFETDDATYAMSLNEPYDIQFSSEMLVDDWQTNPNLVRWYTTGVENHHDNTQLALRTAPPEDGGTREENVEQYQRFVDLAPGTVVANDPENADEVVVYFEFTGRNNQDKNISEEHSSSFDPNLETGDWQLTFVPAADGSLRLANVESSNE